MPSRDKGLSADLGDNRVKWANRRFSNDAPAESACCAQDAFNHDHLILCDVSFRVMQRETRRDTGAGGRAINFTIREDASIAAVMSRVFRSIGKNRAVNETEVTFARI